jgi:D-serine deaminase-like pyridoxal phosphate-dependent protein
MNPMTLHELPTPALLLDIDILERNLSTMQQRARRLGVSLRPHIKTHKCIEIARRQMNLGAVGLTVSTFSEAEQFATAGFNDITWAFPLPLVYADLAAQLSTRITFRVVVDSLEAAEALERAAHRVDKRMHVWLKVDCGYHRAGVDPSTLYAMKLVEHLLNSKDLLFDGILTHAGHSYHARSREEILPVAKQEHSVMVEFAERLHAKGYRVPGISIGSTPTMSVAENLSGITEVRPGNYAFYDYTQAMIGSCGVADCALTVLSSVISHQSGASHFIIDAGALALSKDLGPTHVSNDMDMGILFEDYGRKRLHAHIHLRTLSQEHGKVVADSSATIEGKFRVGDRVRILEHHSCLTAAQFDEYYVVQGERVVDRWKILRRRS